MADKAMRKELREPDEFVSFASRAYQWLQKNWMLVAVAAGAVVLAIVAVNIYSWYSKRQEGAASALFVEAKKILDAPVDDGPALDEQQSDPNRFATEQQKLEAALVKMREVISTYGSSRTGVLARYYEGEILLKLGKHDEARQAFEKYLNEAGEGADFAPYALEGMGFCLEAQGKVEQAREYFQRMTKPPFDVQPDRGLYHLARLAQKQGKIEQARSTYQEILDKYPDSAFRAEVENRLALLPESTAASKAPGSPQPASDQSPNSKPPAAEQKPAPSAEPAASTEGQGQ